MENQWKELLKGLNIGEIRQMEPLSKHTTFRIGGPAEIMVLPNTMEQVCTLLTFVQENQVPLHIFGGGSNLLVSDNGLKGIVLKLGGSLKQVKIDGTLVEAEAGVPLPFLANRAAEGNLGGLEFAAGIPGTIGGAVVMNAGAHNGQMSEIVKEIVCCSKKGEIFSLTNEEARFCYRGSLFKDNKELIILKVICQLKPSDKFAIKARMKEYLKTRSEKQPLNYPSAGSVFKNPPNNAAARLIEEVGAKGWHIGDAAISTKHSNFAVNLGSATSADVLLLLEKVQQAVKEQFNIVLEREILVLEDK